MKETYKVKLTPNPIIIRVKDDKEEIVYDKYLKILVAEKLCEDLNNGFKINFEDLN